jgi:hypothetical protein
MPTVTVGGQGVLLERTAAGISGQVQLKVANTGLLEIQLLEYHYDVQSSEGAVWHGRHAGELVLSPGVDRQATLPLVLFPPSEGSAVEGPLGPVHCRVWGSLVYIGNGVFDETLAEMGYRPQVAFAGEVVLHPAQAARSN